MAIQNISTSLNQTTQNNMISLQGITKQYTDTLAVSNLDVEIPKGQIVALLGSNGAGKSTTIKMICGLLKPTQGKLLIDSKTYEHNADDIRRTIGYMPEESAMYLDVTVIDYLLFFGRLYNLTDTQTKTHVERFCTKLQLIDANHKKLSELSKGMRRKVLLIRSLLNDPELLIYDEPASGLDPQTSQAILNFLLELKNQNKTILFSSHNLEHVRKISDRLLIIKSGVLVADTTVPEFEKHNKREFIVETSSGTHTVSEQKLADFVKQNEILTITQKVKTFEETYLEFITSETKKVSTGTTENIK